MNSFGTLDELWISALGEMPSVNSASRDGDVVAETLGYVARLEDPTANMMFNPVRTWSPSYAAAEFLWYLSGEVSIGRILPYAPQYSRLSCKMSVPVLENGKEGYPDGESIHREVRDCAPGSAYGWRWSRRAAGFTQLAILVRRLTDDPTSRQHVLCHWDPGFDSASIAEGNTLSIPCTIALQFLVRDGRLNMSAFMRSCDIWLGLPYDIFSFTCLQQLLASLLNLKLGWYQHHATSLHLYKRNAEKARSRGRDFSVPTEPHVWNKSPLWTTISMGDKTRDAVDLEEHNRKNKCCARATEEVLGRGSLLSELVIMAASKWTDCDNRITHPLLRKYMEHQRAVHH